MDYAGIIKKIRVFVSDNDKIIWQDDELINMIDEAVKKYCEDTTQFVKTYSIYCDENGKYKFPSDFIRFVAAWNKDEIKIKNVSSNDLNRMRGQYLNIKGLPEYIYNDLANYRGFCLYPEPKDLLAPNYINFDDYGLIDSDIYGVVDTNDYGLTYQIIDFSEICEIVYACYEKLERIKDYMAIVYYSSFLALSNDSEFQNSNQASFFRDRYNERINAYKAINRKNIGRLQNVNFF